MHLFIPNKSDSLIFKTPSLSKFNRIGQLRTRILELCRTQENFSFKSNIFILYYGLIILHFTTIVPWRISIYYLIFH